MRDLDQALADAFDRDAAGRGEPGRAPAARSGSNEAPPAPHFPIPGDRAPGIDRPQHRSQPLTWPATVRALEREHGSRFERLADRLIEARDEHQVRALLITSCHRAEGRTTLVLTVARALARRPGRTLIVDGDLGGPMLARLLGLTPRVGLEDVVLDDAPLAEAMVEVPDDNLSVLPLRGPVARPREFLNEPGWACLMARLRRGFDLVLIDGSPLFTGLSAAILHRPVDAAVLVTHRELTGERSLRQAREVLDAGNIPLLGLAQTFV